MMFRIKLWLMDDIHKIIAALLGFILLAGLAFAGYTVAKSYIDVASRPNLVKKEAEQNAKTFTILYQKKEAQQNNSKDIVLTYDLYLKTPFTSSQMLNSRLQDFFKTVKDKYNVNGNHVRAIGIRIYDRKIVWDNGLTPRAIAMYALDQQYAQTLQDKLDKTQDAGLEKAGVSSSSDATGASSTPILRTTWDRTINNKEKINYNHYTLSTNGLQSFDKTSVTSPLSDQEFAFWLKLKMYEALIGNNNIDAATQLYLNYDLNGQVGYRNFVTISSDFEKFDKRQTSIGDGTNYYPNTVLLRQEAAIYRPQLLLYVLSNGQMVKSYNEAQKQLVKTSPDDYADVIRKHAEDVAKNVDKYGAVNYYQSKVNGKFVNTDPFAATTGAYKKKYPQFSRPSFSPILNENNVFFGQTYSSEVTGQDTN